jgi:hypothetical protein
LAPGAFLNEDRDVSRDRAAADEMVRRTGQIGVPVTAIGGEMVVSFDRPRLERIIQRLAPAQRNGSRQRHAGGAPRWRTIHLRVPFRAA